MSSNKYELDMCNGSIMDKLITFSIPLMLSSVLQLMFNAVDTVVVGRFTGGEALAAVGSTTSLIHMFTNLFIGVSLGANVMVAKYLAANKTEQTSKAVHTAITFAGVSSIVMVFMGFFLSRPALLLMSTPENVIDHAVLYMQIYFAGIPFFMLYNFGASILRAIGDTRRPLYFLAVSGVVNVIINLILVIQFKMGVAGVAIGTVVSEAISAVLVLRCLRKADGAYQLDYRKLKIYRIHLIQMMKIGIPAGLQGIVISFSNALLQSSVNSFGSVAMAGYTASNSLFGFMYVCINSISQACMSFTSQNYGAGKPKRMDRVFIDCVILETIVGTCIGVGVYLLGHQLVGLFTTSEYVIQCGVEILKYSAIPYFLCGLFDMIPAALRGMGYSTPPMLISVIGTVGTRVFWVFFLFPIWRSLSFLFVSYPVSWIITVAIQLLCFFLVRRKVHRNLNAQPASLRAA